MLPSCQQQEEGVVCYHCLKVLPSVHNLTAPHQPTAVRTRTHNFCSTDCLSAAHSYYYSLESQLPLLQKLDQYCTTHGERFPLMAARLALMVAQGSLGSGTAAADSGDMSRISMSSKSSSIGRVSRGLATLSWRSSNSYKRGEDVLSRASSSLAAGTGADSGELGLMCRVSLRPNSDFRMCRCGSCQLDELD
eukprot:GHUV01031743.1.p1 GENE.GHUV01031743.1~~GHUV01031743.1.p1  ORF type:complete len:192 (+),score=63.11 GHUV01031743.1:83-658(+)